MNRNKAILFLFLGIFLYASTQVAGQDDPPEDTPQTTAPAPETAETTQPTSGGDNKPAGDGKKGDCALPTGHPGKDPKANGYCDKLKKYKGMLVPKNKTCSGDATFKKELSDMMAAEKKSCGGGSGANYVVIWTPLLLLTQMFVLLAAYFPQP